MTEILISEQLNWRHRKTFPFCFVKLFKLFFFSLLFRAAAHHHFILYFHIIYYILFISPSLNVFFMEVKEKQQILMESPKWKKKKQLKGSTIIKIVAYYFIFISFT